MRFDVNGGAVEAGRSTAMSTVPVATCRTRSMLDRSCRSARSTALSTTVRMARCRTQRRTTAPRRMSTILRGGPISQSAVESQLVNGHSSVCIPAIRQARGGSLLQARPPA